MKSEMEVPAEWICEESSNWDEIPVTRKWMICLMGGMNWYDIYNRSHSHNSSEICEGSSNVMKSVGEFTTEMTS